VQGTWNRSARFVTHGRGRSPSCPPKIASLPYESASLERPPRKSGPTSLACQQSLRTRNHPQCGSLPKADPLAASFRFEGEEEDQPGKAEALRAWLPWAVLSVFVFLWGIPQVKTFLDGVFSPPFFVPWLDKMVQRMPPLVSKPQAEMPSSISTSYRQRGPGY
jgi:hypothetical protein